VTVTLTNGPGNALDYLVLAPVGAPDTTRTPFTYLGAPVTYFYLGAGAINEAWPVTMPNAGGSYEFRLYLNNTYTRLASSAAVVVTQDLRGTYAVNSGYASLTQTACTDPQNNGTFTPTGSLTVSTETAGGVFTGSGVLNWSIAGLPIQTTLTISSGTVTPPTQPPVSTVAASYTFLTTVNSISSASGSGTMAGSSTASYTSPTSGQISVNITANVTVGETCQVTGTVIAIK
jgi:hypothetical protein